MRWLITGVAGFIGAHTARMLLARGEEVIGIDDINPYYDPELKRARLGLLRDTRFRFVQMDIADDHEVDRLFAEVKPDQVIHLAAQPGVRHALKDHTPYARTNLMGTVHVLEASRRVGVAHVVYASSSSVYGETSITPFTVHDSVDHPVSLYAATKRANELIAHSYSHIFGLPTTGLRFFTVYGPWGRPDMAYYIFARAIADGKPVRVFGDGSALRDFTYIDDVVEGIGQLAETPPSSNPDWDRSNPDPATSPAPYRLFNIGRGHQVRLGEMIDILERQLGRSVTRIYEERKPGDVSQTHADVSDLEHVIGFRPEVSLEDGLGRFATWFRSYHDI